MATTAAFLLVVWFGHGFSMFACDDQVTCWQAENTIRDIGAPVDKMVCVPMKEA